MTKTSYTVTEAARELGVATNWIYQLIRSGKLPAEKYERAWYIPAQSVEARKQKLVPTKDEATPDESSLDTPSDELGSADELPSWSLLPHDNLRAPDSELAAVYSAADEADAQRTQALLKEAGIDSQLQIVVLVSNADSEKALQILSDKLGADSD